MTDLVEKVAHEAATKRCCPEGCLHDQEKCQAHMFYEPELVALIIPIVQEAENEACAKIADAYLHQFGDDSLMDFQDAIRARLKQKVET